MKGFADVVKAVKDVMAACFSFAMYASAIVSSCAAVEYSVDNGNKFNLYDGVFSITGGFDTIVQRCAS